MPLAHGEGLLRLKALTARVTGVRETDAVSNDGTSATAVGTFVIVTLEVSNRSDTPVAFDGPDANQTLLEIDGDVAYTESLDAENQADQASFVSNSAAIEPGESKTGDVIFDVPTARARGITSGRSSSILLVADFGGDLSQGTAALGGIVTLAGS